MTFFLFLKNSIISSFQYLAILKISFKPFTLVHWINKLLLIQYKTMICSWIQQCFSHERLFSFSKNVNIGLLAVWLKKNSNTRHMDHFYILFRGLSHKTLLGITLRCSSVVFLCKHDELKKKFGSIVFYVFSM